MTFHVYNKANWCYSNGTTATEGYNPWKNYIYIDPDQMSVSILQPNPSWHYHFVTSRPTNKDFDKYGNHHRYYPRYLVAELWYHLVTPRPTIRTIHKLGCELYLNYRNKFVKTWWKKKIKIVFICNWTLYIV